MKNIIPYEKDIVFDTKIAEITSISLEHEEETRNEEIDGSFIVSGDYKIHSISVNKTNFSYKIPFNIELSENIDKSSIMVDINDFTYDIKDSNTLTVKIELALTYDELEIQEEVKDEEIKDIEPLEKIEEKEERIEEDIQKEKKEQQEEITNAPIKAEDNTYVTYHVYVVSSEDTIDNICQKFNVSKETLHSYNDFEELKVNDKLLIPIEDE